MIIFGSPSIGVSVLTADRPVYLGTYKGSISLSGEIPEETIIVFSMSDSGCAVSLSDECVATPPFREGFHPEFLDPDTISHFSASFRGRSLDLFVSPGSDPGLVRIHPVSASLYGKWLSVGSSRSAHIVAAHDTAMPIHFTFRSRPGGNISLAVPLGASVTLHGASISSARIRRGDWVKAGGARFYFFWPHIIEIHETLDTVAAGLSAGLSKGPQHSDPLLGGFQGRMVDSRFQLLEKVSTTNFSTVFRAVDIQSGPSPVAVKMLHVAQNGQGELHRFMDECAILRKLGIPGVVRYVQAGFHDGHPYIALEWLQGRTLETELQEHGRFEVRRALSIAGSIAKTLSHVHQRGVIHRDVKPANIMLHNNLCTLMDFGISRDAFSRDGLTAQGMVIGSAPYLAPERLQGEPATVASDTYALGVVLTHMLDGLPSSALIASGEDPVPVGIRRLVEQMCHETPSRRPQDPAAALSLALRALNPSSTRAITQETIGPTEPQ